MSKPIISRLGLLLEFVLVAALCCLWLQPSLADEPRTVKDVCGAEIRAVCAWRFTPDAILSCVKEKRAEISPVCQGFWETARGCQAEIESICGGLNPFTIKGCIAREQHRFSDACRDSFDL